MAQRFVSFVRFVSEKVQFQSFRTFANNSFLSSGKYLSNFPKFRPYTEYGHILRAFKGLFGVDGRKFLKMSALNLFLAIYP